MTKKGFTLVEIVISLVILSMLLGAAYFALGTQIRLWHRTVSAAEKQQVMNAVLTRMVSDIRSAQEILPASDPFTLSFRVGEDVIEYSLINQKVRRKKNGSSSYLTDRGEIQALSFSFPDVNLIKISINDSKTEAALRN